MKLSRAAALIVALFSVGVAGCGQGSGSQRAVQARSSTTAAAATAPEQVPTTMSKASPSSTAPSTTAFTVVTTPRSLPVMPAPLPTVQPDVTVPVTVDPAYAARLAAERAQQLKSCLGQAVLTRSEKNAANDAAYQATVRTINGSYSAGGAFGSGQRLADLARAKVAYHQSQGFIEGQYNLDVSSCQVQYG